MIDWMEQEVYVLGGAGFIGSHLVDVLVEHGAKPVVVDNLCRGRIENIAHNIQEGRVVLRKVDLERSNLPIRAGSVVFHLAAKVTGIDYNRKHQLDMMMTNLLINMHVLESVIVQRPRLFVYVSTACVYPHDAPVPTPEHYGEVCNPEPTNEGYGIAKWVGERMAWFAHKQHGIPTLIVRFFNAFGPRDYYDPETSHVVPALIDRVERGDDPVVVWGSGDQTRVFVDARDIAKALYLLADEPLAYNAMPVNIGHDNEISIAELGRLLLDVAGYKGQELEFDRGKPDGYPRRAADVKRLKRLIGWVPDTPLVETIRDMLEDYRGRYGAAS